MPPPVETGRLPFFFFFFYFKSKAPNTFASPRINGQRQIVVLGAPLAPGRGARHLLNWRVRLYAFERKGPVFPNRFFAQLEKRELALLSFFMRGTTQLPPPFSQGPARMLVTSSVAGVAAVYARKMAAIKAGGSSRRFPSGDIQTRGRHTFRGRTAFVRGKIAKKSKVKK